MELVTLSSRSDKTEENIKQDDSESSLINSSIKSSGISQFPGSSRSESSKSYKEKISSHFESIKQKAIKNHNLKSKIITGSKRHQKQDGERYIKIRLNKKACKTFENSSSFIGNQKFFCGTEVNEGDNTKPENVSSQSLSNDNKEIFVFYSIPQTEHFQLTLSEKDSFMSDGKSINTGKEEHKCWEEGLYINENYRSKKQHIKLLERRLLSIDDKKWFNSHGNLEFLENPLNEASVRPNKKERSIINYTPPVTKENFDEIVIIKENVLEVALLELKFTHHPLFSIEHVLAEKLCDLYDQYLYYIKSNNSDRIKTQLEALRYMRKKIENKKPIDEHTLKRLINIDRDIEKMRKIYLEEGKKERENLKNILNTWKQIKKIREQQHFSNTDIKLLIKKENVDYETDNAKFHTAFQEALKEIIRETKSEVEDSEENRNVDEEDITKNLQNTFQQSLRAPGEPILKLSLSTNNEITKVIEHSKEITRRNTVTSTKIYLNILCDKVAVCKSKPININDKFLIDVNETFSIQLQEMPRCLNIEVIEQPKGLLKKKICEITVDVPPQNVPPVKSKSSRSHFKTNEIVHYKHTGIGSGVNLKEILENCNLATLPDTDCNLTTEGYMEYCIGWQKTTVTKTDPLRDQMDLLKDITDKNLTMNVNKLSEWMIRTVPDPQDPGNVVFFEYIASYDPKLFKNNNNFRLSPHTETLKFCNIHDIEENIRFRILQFRNQNEIEFDGIVIPNRIKEIPINALDNIKKRKLEENKYLSREDVDEEVAMEKNDGRKFLKKVHIKLFQMCKNSENNLVYESVVDEKYLAHFENLVKTALKKFFNWFDWHPNKSLLIKNNTPCKKTSQDYNKMDKQCSVTIKVICGKAIPMRTKHQAALPETYNSNTEFTENEVKPFVEISFENVSVRTSTSSGINPTWNEILILPLEYQNMDYLNPDSLNGIITVNLYDECDYVSKHQNQKSYSWLGAVEIPLSAICYSTNMSGLFKVRLAELLLGYETKTEKHVSKSPKMTSSQSCHTYIEMEIGITPNVPKLIANMESLPCGEIPYIYERIIKWNQNYNENFPNRKFSALAIDTNAKTTCITRYLKALEPPQINLEEFDVTAEQCLRYVSLVPFTECNQFYHNVWLTTNELLHFMIGSVTDHAVALTCYLLALKIDAWLLLGYGIPHGSTAYVLTREYVKDDELPTYSVYDVVYNEKYNLIGSYCPLQKIYCLVNGENVWANTQRSDNVEVTRFDLNRKSDWLPLFDNNIHAPTHFVNNRVIYGLKSQSEYLETHIELKIKKKISKLRQLDRTMWNHNLTNDFKNLLRSFEMNSMYKKNNSETISEFNEKLASYRVTGYILNSAYLNLSTIIKNIKKLGICCQGNYSNEFALAVYIHAYPGPLLSLWIFIGNVKQVDNI